MSDTPENGSIETTVETEYIDLDGDGTIDAVRETTTHLVDVDGDGTIDIVQQTTVTGVDIDGDGEFSDDEITAEGALSVREDLLEEG